jgi:hypothetical protein
VQCDILGIAGDAIKQGNKEREREREREEKEISGKAR